MTLELRSPIHPLYTGKRKPKGSAFSDPDCWELYWLIHPEKRCETTDSQGGTGLVVGTVALQCLDDTQLPLDLRLEPEEITGENKKL